MFKYTVILLVALLNLSLTRAATPPNVIIIFTDDQGYGDVNSFSPTQGLQTPELDQMVAEGLKFTDFYSSSSVCSPSRAGLMTGRYPRRAGVPGVLYPFSTGGLKPSEITIAEALKDKGYATAMIGKWHLGHKPEFLPTSQGFDSYLGIPYSNDMRQDGSMPLAKDVRFLEGLTQEDFQKYQPEQRPAPKDGEKKISARQHYLKYDQFKSKVPLMRDTEVIEWPVDQSQTCIRYTEEAINFIKTNQKQPFFLVYAHTMPHVPLFASENFKGKTEKGLYGDVIEEIDWTVGQVLQTLKELEIDKNTLVVFSSDNGPWLKKGEGAGSAGPLREGKHTTYEGGQRVPTIFWWPGTITAGSVTDFIASNLDLMPTIASLAGAALPQDRIIDGVDISPVLMGKPEQANPRNYFAYARGQAIRVGDWKYRNVRGRKKKGSAADSAGVNGELYNLKEDIGEQKNLIGDYPEKASELQKLLQEHNTNISKY